MKINKLLLLFAFAALLVLTVAKESEIQLEQTPTPAPLKTKKYNWILDMLLIPVNMFILIVLGGPIYGFASFFGNCPQCYVDAVIS